MYGSRVMDLAIDDTGRVVFSASDKRLKKNINDLQGALSKITKLRGVSYEWKEGENPNLTYGLIAQEVIDVMPNIVTQHKGLYGINYSELPAVLIEAIKEQQMIIDTQTEEIKELKAQQKKDADQLASILLRLDQLDSLE